MFHKREANSAAELGPSEMRYTSYGPMIFRVHGGTLIPCVCIYTVLVITGNEALGCSVRAAGRAVADMTGSALARGKGAANPVSPRDTWTPLARLVFGERRDDALKHPKLMAQCTYVCTAWHVYIAL